MMNFSFFFIATFILIVFQTVILPGFSWFPQCFDLLIIVVLYMSLVYSRSGVVFVILMIGGIMDSLSGVPFFLHIFSYLWVFFIVQVFKQFVFQRSTLFTMLVSLAAVSIQQGLMAFSVFLALGRSGIAGLDFTMIVRQMVWGMVVIPAGVWTLNLMRQNYFVLIRQFRRNLVRRYGD